MLVTSMSKVQLIQMFRNRALSHEKAVLGRSGEALKGISIKTRLKESCQYQSPKRAKTKSALWRHSSVQGYTVM